MISRRRIVSTVFPSATFAAQRRFDHERWYGHALELDLGQYKHSNELPPHLKVQHRSDEEVAAMKEWMPKINFSTTYECLLYDADRLNVHLNRKEFANETRFRLEKQANIVSRAQAMVSSGKYGAKTDVEDAMIARIIDEEHVQAEMKYVKCIRANELAEDNRLDILPGGSPNSLREKTRWNLQVELHPVDREEIMNRLMAWLPEKYHIVYSDDHQTVAANDEVARKDMLQIIEAVEKEHLDEAKTNGYVEDLKTTCEDLRNEVDPTRAITEKAIKECSSLETLEQWSRLIHEYNGDARIFEIYHRAAELTKNLDHQKLVQELKQLYAKQGKL